MINKLSKKVKDHPNNFKLQRKQFSNIVTLPYNIPKNSIRRGHVLQGFVTSP